MALEFLVDEPWAASNPNRVKLLGPACVEYGHPDLDAAHKFLIDFGLVEAGRTSVPTKAIFYRGYGVQPVAYVARQTPKPEFRGAYFEAASNEDLIRATMIPGAGDIEELDHPGGGKVVHVVDPAGLSFSIIFGMKKREFSLPPDHHKSHNIPSADYTDCISKPRRGSKLGKCVSHLLLYSFDGAEPTIYLLIRLETRHGPYPQSWSHRIRSDRPRSQRSIL